MADGRALVEGISVEAPDGTCRLPAGVSAPAMLGSCKAELAW